MVCHTINLAKILWNCITNFDRHYGQPTTSPLHSSLVTRHSDVTRNTKSPAISFHLALSKSLVPKLHGESKQVLIDEYAVKKSDEEKFEKGRAYQRTGKHRTSKQAYYRDQKESDRKRRERDQEARIQNATIVVASFSVELESPPQRSMKPAIVASCPVEFEVLLLIGNDF